MASGARKGVGEALCMRVHKVDGVEDERYEDIGLERTEGCQEVGCGCNVGGSIVCANLLQRG